MGHDTALAGDNLLYLGQCVLAAVAYVSQLHGSYASGTLGAERAFSEESVVDVHHPAAGMCGYRDTAAEMGYYEVERSVVLTLFSGVELGDGFLVQCMEYGYSGKHRMSAYAGDVAELVNYHGIRDECPGPVYPGSQFCRKDTAQVAGMLPITGGAEVVQHPGIDFIDTGRYGPEQTSASYDDLDVTQFDTILVQGADDGILPETELVDYALENRNLLGRVPESLCKYFLFPLEKSYLGRSGTGVYCQYICHDSPVLFCCERC